jgi:hypothetical protein
MTTVTVVRDTFQPGCTLGKLYINNVFLCHTLEDTDRYLDKKGVGAKIYASTAIGAGRYNMRISLSPRFKRLMPEVLAVPGFTGIRIHSGNTAEDTEGCILVGMIRGRDKILDSRTAYDLLMKQIGGSKETMTFIVTRAGEPGCCPDISPNASKD